MLAFPFNDVNLSTRFALQFLRCAVGQDLLTHGHISACGHSRPENLSRAFGTESDNVTGR